MFESREATPSADCCAARSELVLEVQNLSVRAGGRSILSNVSMEVRSNQVFGIIGPSGAGKSTLLRCLNRLSDLTPELGLSGEVRFRGCSIFGREVDVDALRQRIGIVFQQPVVFPVSVVENVLFGAQRLRRLSRGQREDCAEAALREAALWDEVKDRLRTPARALSVGQQQRLCLARTLAVSPEILLMDEPTSALDPRSTRLIEDLILQLRQTRAVVLVTHDVEQARRVTDWLACVCVKNRGGELVESACCDALLGNPQCREVIEYLGRSVE